MKRFVTLHAAKRMCLHISAPPGTQFNKAIPTAHRHSCTFICCQLSLCRQGTHKSRFSRQRAGQRGRGASAWQAHKLCLVAAMHLRYAAAASPLHLHVALVVVLFCDKLHAQVLTAASGPLTV